MQPKFRTIDEYLKTVTADRRKALERLRKTIRSVIPKAEECFSYGMSAFRLNGTVVAGFLATAQGLFIFSVQRQDAHDAGRRRWQFYQQTKGSLHFDPAKALPVALVRKLIRTRIAEETRTDR